MRLAGYQPQYFPRLHYFARILDSDIFAISDHVQFVKKHVYPAENGKKRYGRSYQADTPIKGNQQIQFLAVPVKHEGLQPINQAHIIYDFDWQHDHLKTIKINYGRSPRTKELLPQIATLLQKHYDNLAQLTTATIIWSLYWIFGHTAPSKSDLTIPAINDYLTSHPHPFRLKKIILKSDSAIKPPGEYGDALDWIIATCQLFGANEYYHGGTAALAYLDPKRFTDTGISLIEQQWQGQPYNQRFTNLGFTPNLSIIDLLANEDTATTQRLLTTTNP